MGDFTAGITGAKSFLCARERRNRASFAELRGLQMQSPARVRLVSGEERPTELRCDDIYRHSMAANTSAATRLMYTAY